MDRYWTSRANQSNVVECVYDKRSRCRLVADTDPHRRSLHGNNTNNTNNNDSRDGDGEGQRKRVGRNRMGPADQLIGNLCREPALAADPPSLRSISQPRVTAAAAAAASAASAAASAASAARAAIDFPPRERERERERETYGLPWT